MSRTTNPNKASVTLPLLPVLRFNNGDDGTVTRVVEGIDAEWIKTHVTFEGMSYAQAAEAMLLDRVITALKGRYSWKIKTTPATIAKNVKAFKRLTIKPRVEAIISKSAFLAKYSEELPFLAALSPAEFTKTVEIFKPGYILID